MYNGRVSDGGNSYGSHNLPCELGSGTEGPHESYGHVAGGGMIGKRFSKPSSFKWKQIMFLKSNDDLIFLNRCKLGLHLLVLLFLLGFWRLEIKFISGVIYVI